MAGRTHKGKPQGTRHDYIQWGLRIGLLGFVLLVTPAQAKIDPNSTWFHRITLADPDTNIGNNGPIRSIAQDHHGFIWIGTEYGLIRFDGHDTVLYQNDFSNPNSIIGNYIQSLLVDRHQQLWITTTNGLSRYDEARNQFTNFVHQPEDSQSIASNQIAHVIELNADEIAIATTRGISILNHHKNTFRQIRNTPHAPNTLTSNQIETLTLDKARNTLWVGTNKGINSIDLSTFHIRHFLDQPTTAHIKEYINTRSIIIYPDGSLWLGLFGNGIIRFDPSEMTYRFYQHNPTNKYSLPSDNISHLVLTSNNEVWIATDHGGVSAYNHEDDSFINFAHDSGDINSLSSNQTRYIFEDKNNNLWVGTYTGNINIINRTNTAFRNYYHRPNDENSLNDNALLSIEKTQDNVFWFGTEKGLAEFTSENEAFIRYTSNPQDKNTLKANPIISIEPDKNNNLWLGTWAGGLHYFDRQKGVIKRYSRPDDLNGLESKFVWSLHLDSRNQLWIGTQDLGLFRFDITNNNFKRYAVEANNPNALTWSFAKSIVAESERVLWVGTLNGLNRLDTKTEKFSHFFHKPTDKNSLCSNRITVLYYHTVDKTLWIGTEDNGLSILDTQTQTFTAISTQDGLPSANIATITADQLGNMWIGTTSGIVKIDATTKILLKILKKRDGLAGNVYNRHASYTDESGDLYFGSLDGLTRFNPQAIDNIKNTQDKVILTHLQVNNKTVHPETTEGFTSSIQNIQSMTLPHKNNSFSLNFSNFNFLSARAQNYQYRLLGYHDHWIDTKRSNFLNYTNIDPGKYLLQVKSVDAQGKDTSQHATLNITITTPWWKRPEAYFLYALTFLLVVLATRHFFIMTGRSRELEKLSATDPLTGILNRYGISSAIEKYQTHRGLEQALTVCLFDIDHFKKINDQYGHDIGDKILIDFAAIVSQAIRANDIWGRWGGEEFILIFEGDASAPILAKVNRIRKSIEQYPFEDNEQARIHVTTSIGCATNREPTSFKGLVKQADIALYQAKNTGRNQSVLYTQTMEEK